MVKDEEVRGKSKILFYIKTCIWEDTMKTIIKDNNEQINSRAGLGLPVAIKSYYEFRKIHKACLPDTLMT